VRVCVISIDEHEQANIWDQSSFKIFRLFSQVIMKHLVNLKMHKSVTGLPQLKQIVEFVIKYHYHQELSS